MPGIRKASGPQKYNKVNQQKKFQLLTLFYKHHLPLKEAASQTGINYLTAKTIVFFHKKDHKSYQFDLRLTSHLPPFRKKLTASYIYLKKRSPHEEKASASCSRIEVICSTGNVPISEDSRDCNRGSYSPNDIKNSGEAGLSVVPSLDEDHPFPGTMEIVSKMGSPKLPDPGTSMISEQMSSQMIAKFEAMTHRLLLEIQNLKAAALPVKTEAAQ